MWARHPQLTSAKVRLSSSESETRYRDVVENSLDCVCVHDIYGRILAVNPAFIRAVGAGFRSELVGTSIIDLLHPSAINEFPRYLATLLRDEKAEGTMRIRTRGGETRLFEYRNTLHRDADGEATVYSTARDVTEQRRAAKRLVESERRFRALFEKSIAAVAITTLGGRFVDANETTVRLLLAPSREALLDRSTTDLYADLSDRRLMLAKLESEGEISMELPLRRFDGSYVWAFINANLIDFGPPHGKVILTNALDITARKEIEESVVERLRQSERDYRALFEHAHEPILVLEPGSERVLDANRAACRTYGLSKEEMLAHSMRQFSLPDARDRSLEVLDGGDGFVDFPSVQKRADGRLMDLEISAGAIVYRGSPAILSINRDVTERRELQKNLLRAERMSAMGTLVAGVLHEVRNPLFSISATVDALEVRMRDELPARSIERLRGDIDRLRTIMNDLLEYGSPHRLNLEHGVLRDVLTEAAVACAPLAEEQGVVVEVEPFAGRVEIDVDRMRQVFQNLIENAMQHSPRGGVVRLRAREDARCVEIAVEDQGPGFDLADLPQVFEPFFTKRRGGTGLGLSIVRKIVEEHGGTVEAANRPEGGGTVRVSLRR